MVDHQERHNTQNHARAKRATKRPQRESDSDSDSDAPPGKRISSDFEVQLFLSAASGMSDS